MKINDKVDFSSDMNLPKKTISTNADLTKKESFFLARIQDVRRYREVLSKNKLSNVIYNILENPMVIRNELSPTYIQNKILKDMVIRYRLLSGAKVNHNLDFIHIDDMLENQKEKTAKLQEVIKKRDARKKELTETVKKQVQNIKDLGTIINYSNFNSSTLNKEFESRIIEKFWELYKEKKIYHDLRPVNWCPKCKRALENDNISRKKQDVENYFLNFRVKYDKGLFSGIENFDDTYFVASTIRPWILDFDNSLAVVEDMEYSVVQIKQRDKNVNYIIASEFVDYIMEIAFYIKYDIKKKILGKELIGMTCNNALENTKDLNVIPAKKEYVVLNPKHSSGIAIISSGNTYVDYLVSNENSGIKINNNLSKDGKTTMLAYNFKNMYYKEVNEKVLENIKSKKYLLCTDLVKIKMPKCQECGEDVVYRNELEWYIKKNENDEKLKSSFDNIISKLNDCKETKKTYIKEKLYESIQNREKIISNESAFGTPIPVFYCAECSSEVVNDKVISILKELFKTKGIESWYKETPEEILKGEVICEKCGCSFLFKSTTSLNEFFKLMCVPLISNLTSENGVDKVNICIENIDTFIRKIKTISYDDKSLEEIENIDKILLHPKVNIAKEKMKKVDEKDSAEDKIDKNKKGKNKKEEKSKDKSIKKEEVKTLNNNFNMSSVVKKYGTDVLRLWCVQRSSENTAVLSESNVIYINKIYKQIRRTIKFLLSNLYDFNPNKDKLSIDQRDDLDKYMYIKLMAMKKEVEANYDNLDLYKVYLNVLKFCNESLCNEYFNVIKFRLYVLNANDKKRKSTQSTLYEIFMTLLLFLEPILPFTFEETWSYIWHSNAEEENNLMLFRNKLMPVDIHQYESAIRKWNNIFFIVNKVNIKIKKEILDKKIKNSLQAKVILGINQKTKEFIDLNHEDFLRSLNVSVLETNISDKSYIKIETADGVECKRCRNYSLDIGKDIKYRHLCPVCAKIMNEKVDKK